MTASSRDFLSVKEAAEALGVANSTVCEAIRAGRLQAIRVGETLTGARIPRAQIFPPDESTADLRTRRLRKLTLTARDKRDAADRKRAEWLDAEREANDAIRAIEHELALDELDISQEQRQRRFAAV